jgi:trigger factor
MEISVEQTSELGRKMTVTLAESVVVEKMAPRLQELTRTARVDGFRRGKVPLTVIKKMFGSKVRDEVISDLIQSSYFDALKEKELNPAGYPHIDVTDNTANFSYTADFEIYPIVSLDNVDHFAISKQEASVQESDVDAMLVKLQTQRKTWKPVKRAAKKLDRVTINFSGISEGENFTNGTSEGHDVEIGEGQMIPGFEDHLKGVKPGDSKTFTIDFPVDYPHEKLAGKPAEFTIDVTEVQGSVLPDIDEEFIKSYGTEDGTIESFRHDIKENMTRELKAKLAGNVRQSLLSALYDKVNVTLPKSLIDAEIEELLKPYRDMAKKNNIDINMLNLTREQFEEQAQKRVTLNLVVGEIIHQHNMVADEAQVRARVEEMAQSYDSPAQVIEWYYKDDNRLTDVKQAVMDEQVVNWLLAKATVTTENVDFDAVMNNA